MGLDISKMGAGVAASEAERDKKRHTGFLGGLFRGKADFGLFMNLPENGKKKEGDQLVSELRKFLVEKVDSRKIDRENEIPAEDVEWLCENGFFALKLPEEYGGKNLNQENYLRVMSLVASHSGALTALISASNTIGLSWPLKGYGTKAQKDKYLAQVGKAPSAFAFTEAEAGSDPASMVSYAKRVRNAEGKVTGYLLTGEKWWTTNGPKNDAEILTPLLCVVAKTVDDPAELKDPTQKPCFSAFIVPSNLPGIKVVQRCDFEGLRGIYNGITQFKDVELPMECLVGEKEGLGFRIALEALNTGRLAISGACVAVAKQCLCIGKWWSLQRTQWGKQIGYHELAGSGTLAKGLAETQAMDSMVKFAAKQIDRGQDARLESAACKVFGSERAWKIADDTLQLRGGRGYETADSLAKRGEPPIPMEQIHRDARINRIFEGSSEILFLWVIREGTDEYKKKGDIFFTPGNYVNKAMAAMGFGTEIARLLMPQQLNPAVKSRVHSRLHRHLRFVQRNSQLLALAVILASARYMAKMVNKQLLFQRLFWISSELYAMTATCLCGESVELSDLYCREAEIRVKAWFRSLVQNTDDLAYKVSKKMLEGEYDEFLKKDIIPIIDQLGLKTLPPFKKEPKVKK